MDRRARLWRLAFYVAFLASALVLLAPGSAVPAPPFPGADKLEHALAFAALALLARPAYPEKPPWGIFLALAIWGAATELAQRDVPGREADALDWAADAVGASVVLLLRRR